MKWVFQEIKKYQQWEAIEVEKRKLLAIGWDIRCFCLGAFAEIKKSNFETVLQGADSRRTKFPKKVAGMSRNRLSGKVTDVKKSSGKYTLQILKRLLKKGVVQSQDLFKWRGEKSIWNFSWT